MAVVPALSFQAHFESNSNSPVLFQRQRIANTQVTQSYTQRSHLGEAEQNFMEVSAVIQQNGSHLSTCHCCTLSKCMCVRVTRKGLGKTQARRDRYRLKPVFQFESQSCRQHQSLRSKQMPRGRKCEDKREGRRGKEYRTAGITEEGM